MHKMTQLLIKPFKCITTENIESIMEYISKHQERAFIFPEVNVMWLQSDQLLETLTNVVNVKFNYLRSTDDMQLRAPILPLPTEKHQQLFLIFNFKLFQSKIIKNVQLYFKEKHTFMSQQLKTYCESIQQLENHHRIIQDKITQLHKSLGHLDSSS